MKKFFVSVFALVLFSCATIADVVSLSPRQFVADYHFNNAMMEVCERGANIEDAFETFNALLDLLPPEQRQTAVDLYRAMADDPEAVMLIAENVLRPTYQFFVADKPDHGVKQTLNTVRRAVRTMKQNWAKVNGRWVEDCDKEACHVFAGYKDVFALPVLKPYFEAEEQPEAEADEDEAAEDEEAETAETDAGSPSNAFHGMGHLLSFIYRRGTKNPTLFDTYLQALDTIQQQPAAAPAADEEEAEEE